MYRTIHTELWTDDKVIALEPLGKLLFLYLITNPHAHLSGLYYLPKSFMIEETGMSGRGIDTLLHTLSIPYLIQYDERLRVMFVVNMFEYQAKGPKNLKCAASHLLTLHNSSLIQAFIKRYPEIAPFVSDTLSDTLSIGDTSTPVPVPDSSLLTNQSSDLKSKTHVNGRDYRAESKTILAFLNEKTGKQFREVEANLTMIEARLKSGVDVQTCRSVIARKVRDWSAKPDMVTYLRPETLFNKTKFEGYLAEVTP